MATKLDRMITYLDGLLPITLHGPLIMWSCKINHYISTTTVPMANKPDRMITYLDALLSV